MPGPPIVGVDPGSRFAGIVTITPTGDLLAASVHSATRLGVDLEPALWRRHVLRSVTAAVLAAAQVDPAASLAVAEDLVRRGAVLVGVEDVVAPNRFAGRAAGARDGIAAMGPLLVTATIVGSVLERYPEAILVRPRGNGAGADVGYPAGIRKGTRGLGGPPEHARSAYDVAITARQHNRYAGQPTGART